MNTSRLLKRGVGSAISAAILFNGASVGESYKVEAAYDAASPYEMVYDDKFEVQATEQAMRQPFVAAPEDPIDTPNEIENYLRSRAVTVLGCTGLKVFVDNKYAGVVTAEHCLYGMYNPNSTDPNINTYGFRVYEGANANTEPSRIADDLIVYRKIDAAFLAFPGYVAPQIASAFFAEISSFNWSNVDPGNDVYFAGAPTSFEKPTDEQHRPIQVFAASAVGIYSTLVYKSATTLDSQTYQTFDAIMNLTQDGRGCNHGSSGAIAMVIDNNGNKGFTLPLAAFSTFEAGRQTILKGFSYTIPKAIEKQQLYAQKTGYRPQGALACSFAVVPSDGVGPSLNVRFVNGR